MNAIRGRALLGWSLGWAVLLGACGKTEPTAKWRDAEGLVSNVISLINEQDHDALKKLVDPTCKERFAKTGTVADFVDFLLLYTVSADSCEITEKAVNPDSLIFMWTEFGVMPDRFFDITWADPENPGRTKLLSIALSVRNGTFHLVPYMSEYIKSRLGK